MPPCHHPLSLPTSISPGGPDPRAVCASAPSSAKRTDAAARSVPVRSTPSLPCWVLGFKGTLEPAGLACCGRRWSGRSGPLFVTLAQGLLILYHLGRPPLVAELSFALDAIPTLALLCRHKQPLLSHQQYHLASPHTHPCCGALHTPLHVGRSPASVHPAIPTDRSCTFGSPLPKCARESAGAMASTARNNPHNELMSALSTSVSSRAFHLSIPIRQRNSSIPHHGPYLHAQQTAPRWKVL